MSFVVFLLTVALIIFATYYLRSPSTKDATRTEYKPQTGSTPIETKKEIVPEVVKEVQISAEETPQPSEQLQAKEVVKADSVVQETKVEDKQIQIEANQSKEHKESIPEEPKKEEVKTAPTTTERVETEAPDTIPNAGVQNEVQQPQASSAEVDCEIVVAQYAFKARSERELSFQPGDEVVILIKNESGWYRGQNLTTKHLGWFPLNYCTPTGKTKKLPIEFTYPEQVEQVEEEQDSEDQSQLKVASNKVQSKIAQLQQQLREQNTENPVFT